MDVLVVGSFFLERKSSEIEDGRSKVVGDTNAAGRLKVKGLHMMFEDLEAWQQARQLVNAAYAVTRVGNLAKDFRLCSQIQAAAVSIMSNIAEGFERTHLQEKIQFFNTARGSTGEVRSLLYVVSDNYPGSAAEAERLRESAISVGKLVTGLLQSTEARKQKPAKTYSVLLAPIFYLLAPISYLIVSTSSRW